MCAVNAVCSMAQITSYRGNISGIELLISSAPPSATTLSCVDISEDVSRTVNVTVSWTGSGADSYLININTNAPQTPYGGLLNITTGSVTQHELTGVMAGYEYNITVRGVTSDCGGLVGRESEPLTITPQGTHCTVSECYYTLCFKCYLECNMLINHVGHVCVCVGGGGGGGTWNIQKRKAFFPLML